MASILLQKCPPSLQPFQNKHGLKLNTLSQHPNKLLMVAKRIQPSINTSPRGVIYQGIHQSIHTIILKKTPLSSYLTLKFWSYFPEAEFDWRDEEEIIACLEKFKSELLNSIDPISHRIEKKVEARARKVPGFFSINEKFQAAAAKVFNVKISTPDGGALTIDSIQWCVNFPGWYEWLLSSDIQGEKTLDELNATQLRILDHFVKHGSLPKLDYAELSAFIKIAPSLCSDGLDKACAAALKPFLNDQNIFDNLDFALASKNETLIAAVFEFIHGFIPSIKLSWHPPDVGTGIVLHAIGPKIKRLIATCQNYRVATVTLGGDPIMQSIIWERISFRGVRLLEIPPGSGSLLKEVGRHFPDVQTVVLKSATKAGTMGSKDISNYRGWCLNGFLGLKLFIHPPSKNPLNLDQKYQTIHSLNHETRLEIDDPTDELIAELCFLLKFDPFCHELLLNRCSQITDQSIFELGRVGKELTTLRLLGGTGFTDRIAGPLTTNFPTLRKLQLDNCSQLTDHTIIAIANQLKDLRELSLAHCPNVTDQSGMLLAANLTELSVISIKGSPGITDQTAVLLAGLKRLKKFEVAGSKGITDETGNALLKISDSAAGDISLDLRGATISGAILDQLDAKFQELKKGPFINITLKRPAEGAADSTQTEKKQKT